MPGHNPRQQRLTSAIPGHNAGQQRLTSAIPGHNAGQQQLTSAIPGHNVGQQRLTSAIPGHNAGQQRLTSAIPGHNAGQQRLTSAIPGHNAGQQRLTSAIPGHNAGQQRLTSLLLGHNAGQQRPPSATSGYNGGRHKHPSAMSSHTSGQQQPQCLLQQATCWGGGAADGGPRANLVATDGDGQDRATSAADEMNSSLQEAKAGADVHADLDPSPVSGANLSRGLPSQVESAVTPVSQEPGSQEVISAQAQTFWLQWVEAAFPDLDKQVYFLPPVYINRVHVTTRDAAGQEVQVLEPAPGQAGQSSQPTPPKATGQSSQPTPPKATGQSSHPTPPKATGRCNHPTTNPVTPGTPLSVVEDSDVRDDAAMQRVLFCLQKMFERNGEVLVGLSHLEFRHYLSEPAYAAAVAPLPLPSSLPRFWRRGDFDVLLIHRHHGFVVCEVKAFGDNVEKLQMSRQDIDSNISKKMSEAVTQLKKAEAMLSHLVSDIAPGLRITKTIAFPNLSAHQLQQAISQDTRMTQDLCRCLGASNVADIPGLCLCSDQLSDPKTPCDVSGHVLRQLGHWWQRRVAGAGPDSHMTCHLYKTLVARFCGPATTVTVPCTSVPHLHVKTLGQAVWLTGECYTARITLFPEQVHLLNTAFARVFLAGPPGTGKTVVLQLKGREWLWRGHQVYIVSTWWGSRAACSLLYHLLQQSVDTQSPAQPTRSLVRLRQYDFNLEKEVDKAVNDLSEAARSGVVYVIADEACDRPNFQIFCCQLLARVPGVHLWAASCYHVQVPAHWRVESLTRPLRSPPAVVREVEQDEFITKHRIVQTYSQRGVPDRTDGPPIRRLSHRGEGHSERPIHTCVECGAEVATFLFKLRAGVPATMGGEPPPLCLKWSDVLLLYDWGDITEDSGIVTGLREAGIPVRVMKDDDIEDVATARSDVVWVANGHHVRGLERKVVVCLERVDVNPNVRLHFVSRCTSQLVILSPDD
ncbi:uncharacterized protein LOC112561811 isoform X2 [Pomacea canaliculata]|uniref:uncharacterized protein LOC112561811 isoform X2 n=1 Tax=Pomacea canaliculata TaxID=400727 RepID=UPI000D72A699|nr:uncharacterized protein LOC112561811 isoform X2 [Pomacea canaliculata]